MRRNSSVAEIIDQLRQENIQLRGTIDFLSKIQVQHTDLVERHTRLQYRYETLANRAQVVLLENGLLEEENVSLRWKRTFSRISIRHNLRGDELQ